jgi:hypothetical protein
MGEHGLRDNVGLIVLLRAQTPAPPSSPEDFPAPHDEGPTLIVANTHLLFNPKRGDIKAPPPPHTHTTVSRTHCKGFWSCGK